MNDSERRPLGFWQAVANRIITMAAGMAAGLALSDVETGFKAFRTSLAQSVPLRSHQFGLDPELVIQFARRRARFVEVPITYRGRTVEQGKKIRLSDALDAFGSILRAWLFSGTHSDHRANMLAALSGATRFNRWMADTVAPWVKGDVLELGAGTGNLTVLLADGTHRYVATDNERESLFELRSRLEYRPDIELALCDVSRPEDAERFRRSADTVVCLNVLEHAEDDRLALANLHKCLRPGGTAIIFVPQGPEIFGSMDEVLQHKRRYRKEELQEKLSTAGFTVARMIGFNHAARPAWYLNSRLLRRRSLSRVQLRLFDLLVPLWQRIDNRLPWPATTLIAIGVADSSRVDR
jgi:SAM-dependent methyltransferase